MFYRRQCCPVDKIYLSASRFRVTPFTTPPPALDQPQSMIQSIITQLRSREWLHRQHGKYIRKKEREGKKEKGEGE